MALSTNSTFEVRTTGNDNNGGGFVTGASGTDYSQQNAAQYSGTDLVIDGVTNTKVTSATHNFVAADVGNIMQISGGTHMVFSGVSGQCIFITAAANAIVPTNDIDVRAKVALTNWTSPATIQYIANRILGSTGWGLRVTTGGLLSFQWYNNSSVLTTVDSTVATGFAANAINHIRATLRLNNGSSVYEVIFYTSPDGTTWTQLGATVLGGAVTTVITIGGNTPLYLGNLSNGAASMSGKFYSFELRNGVGGALMANPDFSNTLAFNATNTTYADNVGLLWFVNVVIMGPFNTGFFQIMSVASNAATLDRAAGTLGSTGGTFAVGGALATWQKPMLNLSTGMRIWVTGSYTVGNGLANTAANGVTLVNVPSPSLLGYGTVRGDTGRATLTCGGASMTILNMAASDNNSLHANLILDGANFASTRGINGSSGSARVFNCKGQNFTNIAFTASSLGTLFDYCEATGCSVQPAFVANNLVRCSAHHNSVTGFSHAVGVTVVVYHCVSYANTGATSHGFNGADFRIGQLGNCVAHGNGGNGFNLNNGRQQDVRNCIAYGNTGIGFNLASGNGLLVGPCSFSNSAYGANAGGNTALLAIVSYNLVTLTADPFVNAAAGDFRLNTVAGGGAACRALGIGGAVGTLSYPDIGVSQHLESGPWPTSTSITCAQSCGARAENVITAVAPVFTSPVTAGRLIVVGVTTYNSATATVTVTDNLGNTYTQAGSYSTGTVSYPLERASLWYAKNITGGACTITVTPSVASYTRVTACEYVGADPTAPLDAVATTNGATSPFSSGTVAVAQAGELIVCCAGIINGETSITPGPDVAVRGFLTTSNVNHVLMDRPASSANAATCSMAGVVGGWTSASASFKSVYGGDRALVFVG